MNKYLLFVPIFLTSVESDVCRRHILTYNVSPRAERVKQDQSNIKYNFHPEKKIDPLSTHDALKHIFTSLKTDLIFLQHTVFEQKLP